MLRLGQRLRGLWRRWCRRSVLRTEADNLRRAIYRTEKEISRQIEKYRDYPCCPSCASNALELHSIDYLSARNRRRRERLEQIEAKLRRDGGR